ncbi:MAG: isoprenylcysteine carboxylmethyltransferase family protein [Hyphomicrobiales bacterium]|nr:isoprenylcysteine carboxylmethyltransferase family protein [Hyphomicrobiales bacterium]MBV8662855.1 isoprenylcysteine carboxylmethyltransferase family protein [Hyphomicrobiales bacterium]
MSLSPKMAVFTTIGTLAYLALAVAGEGGLAAYVSQPALVALALITMALGASALFTKGNLSSGVREVRDNRWVLIAFGAIGLLLGYLPALTDRLDVLTIGGDPTRWLGVALYAAGGALRIAPVFVLKERFSGLVALQPGHQLVTDGLYRVIRNPSYLGLLVNAVGWALAFRSGIGILLVACLLPPLIARMRAEEALLGEAFGAQYQAYRARTWRLVPGLY